MGDRALISMDIIDTESIVFGNLVWWSHRQGTGGHNVLLTVCYPNLYMYRITGKSEWSFYFWINNYRRIINSMDKSKQIIKKHFSQTPMILTEILKEFTITETIIIWNKHQIG